MERITKKIMAIVLAIALVVSTLSIQPNTTKAGEYDSLTWTQVGTTNYYVAAGNNEFGFQLIEDQTTKMLIIPNVASGTNPIWPDFTNVTLNGEAFNQPAGAGIYIDYSALTDNAYNVFQATSNQADVHVFQIIIKAGNPDGGSGTVEPTSEQESEAGGTTDPEWVTLAGNTVNTNTYSYNKTDMTVSSVVNIQTWESTTGIYITIPDAGITGVTVNDTATTGYSVQGSGVLLHLSALSEGENKVAITNGAGTYTVTIKQEGAGTVEPPSEQTTNEPTADADGYYPITADAQAFYVGNQTWRLYSSGDEEKQVWGTGIMRYKGGTSDSDLSLKIVKQGQGVGTWNLQAHYAISGLTAGKQYTYTVTYTTTNAGKMRYKIDGTGATDEVDNDVEAGTVTYTDTFTAVKESDMVSLDLSGMPTGTIINFNSIEVKEVEGGEVPTDPVDVEKPEDVPASSWKPVTNSATVFYYVTNGADGKVNTPIMQTNELYCAMGLAAPFTSVTFDGTAMTPTDGAYVNIPKTSLTVGYHTLTVVNYYNNDTLTVYYKVEAEAETTTPEPTTAPTYAEDGTELLKDTAFDPNDIDAWMEYGGLGENPYTNNGDDDSDGYGSVDVQVPAYAAGDNWATQLVQTNIQLFEGKWYVARFEVSSDVDKSFQLLIQSDGAAGGDWSVFAQDTVEVSAGGSQTVEIQFQATSTTAANVLFGIMMGYVNGTASDEANVTISNVSLKGYETEQKITGSHSNLLTSADIFVQGFQMKTNWDASYEGDFGFRTVCQAPSAGEKVKVNNVEYTVANVGAIYTIEADTNIPEGVTFDSTCTLLHYNEAGELESDAGILGVYVLATDKGIVATDGTNSTYVQTIEGELKQFPAANKIHVRAFVVTTGGTIIYSQKSVNTSVAKVASYMYSTSMATNYKGHEYLYNTFVNVNEFVLDANEYFTTPKTNPYYSSLVVDYGWNDNLYTPDGEHYLNLKPDVYLKDDYLNATDGSKVDVNTAGGVISVAGLKYSYGISSVTGGSFEYEVPYNASHFVGIVGIDDNASTDNGGTITCEVSFDGVKAYTTNTLSYGKLEYIKVLVPTGTSTIKIEFKDSGVANTVSIGNAGWIIDESIDDKYDTSNDPSDITRIYVYTEEDNPLITKEEKTDASITIISGEAAVNSVSQTGTIKLRGNSTALADKPAYNISFDSKQKVFENANAGKKWSLLSNPFDKTLLRNKLAMDLGIALGGIATPEEHFADLYINGELKGTYLISEPADNGRSGIEYNEDTELLFELEVGREETGVLYNTTGLGVKFAVEDVEAASEAYTNYLDTLNTFETALNNATTSDDVLELIDVDSFVTMYIVNELFKTVDFGYSSVKFYTKKDGDKTIIHAGSLWDFDLSSGNSGAADATTRTTDGFRGQDVNTWFRLLMQNATFKQRVIDKYAASQDIIQNIYEANGKGDSQINQNLAYMGASKDRNYLEKGLGGAGWKINVPDSAEIKYYPYGYNTLSAYQFATYDEHVQFLINWLKDRNAWICGQWGITP